MEQKHIPRLPNLVEVSEFGYEYLQRLPNELDTTQSFDPSLKEITSHPNLFNPYSVPHKGQGLDFHTFANQTQSLLRTQTRSLSKGLTSPSSQAQSKRKLQLHHEHWMSQQKLLKHKIADIQARMQQSKYGEYDWSHVREGLRKNSKEVFREVHCNLEGRRVRTREKLKRLLQRKYPGRGQE